MIGTTLTSPTAPSARPFRSGTSSDTCQSSAAFCMKLPVNDSSSPIQIRRKFRYRSATIDRRENKLPGREHVAEDRMGLVLLGQEPLVVGRQPHVQRADGIVEM